MLWPNKIHGVPKIGLHKLISKEKCEELLALLMLAYPSEKLSILKCILQHFLISLEKEYTPDDLLKFADLTYKKHTEMNGGYALMDPKFLKQVQPMQDLTGSYAVMNQKFVRPTMPFLDKIRHMSITCPHCKTTLPMEEYDSMSGGSLFSTIGNFFAKTKNKVKSVFDKSISVSTDDIVDKYGAYLVKRYNIVRTPVQKIPLYGLEVISLGSFDQHHKEDLKHLFIILELQNPTTGEYAYLMTEKAPQIIWETRSDIETKHSDHIIADVTKTITLAEVVAFVKDRYKDQFNNYSPDGDLTKGGNCQTYISVIVHALGTYKYDAYINQAIQDSARVGHHVTDIALAANKVIGGTQKRKYTKKVDKMIKSVMDGGFMSEELFGKNT